MTDAFMPFEPIDSGFDALVDEASGQIGDMVDTLATVYDLHTNALLDVRMDNLIGPGADMTSDNFHMESSYETVGDGTVGDDGGFGDFDYSLFES